MSKRTIFTTISPLPAGIPREVVIEFLQNHLEMIDLNPLVKERHLIKPPAHASPEEQHCVWYQLTDKISYLPGNLASGDVKYTCAFHNLPNGLQTHCYAPMGLDIRDKWTVGGNLPGEPMEPVELGIGAPLMGLYIREDVDMKCNVMMTSFVKRNLKKSHGVLVEKLKSKAEMVAAIKASQPQGNMGPSGMMGSPHSSMSSIMRPASTASTVSSGWSQTPPPPHSPDPMVQHFPQNMQSSYASPPGQFAPMPGQQGSPWQRGPYYSPNLNQATPWAPPPQTPQQHGAYPQMMNPYGHLGQYPGPPGQHPQGMHQYHPHQPMPPHTIAHQYPMGQYPQPPPQQQQQQPLKQQKQQEQQQQEQQQGQQKEEGAPNAVDSGKPPPPVHINPGLTAELE